MSNHRRKLKNALSVSVSKYSDYVTYFALFASGFMKIVLLHGHLHDMLAQEVNVEDLKLFRLYTNLCSQTSGTRQKKIVKRT